MSTRTQYYVAASLDGYIADAAGGLDWLHPFDAVEPIGAHYTRFLEGVGALAMASATYEFLRAHHTGPWPYPGRTTWVFSHQPREPYPGADLRFVQGDVAAVHPEMVRAAAGRNVWLVGGGKLAAQFAAVNLLDELILGVVPVVLGAGVPVLPQRIAGVLRLEAVEPVGGGFVALRYTLPGRNYTSDASV